MTRSRWSLVAGVAALGGVLALLATSVPAPGIVGRGDPLLIEILACAGLGAVGAAALCRAPRRAALAVILIAGVAAPLVSFAPKAPLSDDLYRYAWDGRVQAAGVDPYRYTPVAPQLAHLHDRWLFPDAAGCAALARPTGCTQINRPDVHTIYPPVAEAYFLAIDVTGLDRLHDRGLEFAGLLVELAVLAVMLSLLRSGDGRAAGQDPRLLAFWVLSPLPALEIVSDAHVDGLGLLLSLLAFVALRRRHPLAAAALVSVATLVKLYPALLLVAILDRRPREAAKQVGVFAAVFALGYAPHVAVVGTKVLGYLPGYLREEHYDAGTRYLLLGIIHLRGHLATALVVVLMAAVIGLVVLRRPPPLIGATWLLGGLLLLTTPVQPWYAVSLGGIAVCAGRWEWLAVGVAGYPLYFAAVLNGNTTRDGELSYGLAGAFVLAVVLIRGLNRRGAAPTRTPQLRSRSPWTARTPAPAGPAGTTP